MLFRYCGAVGIIRARGTTGGHNVQEGAHVAPLPGPTNIGQASCSFEDRTVANRIVVDKQKCCDLDAACREHDIPLG